MISIKTFTFNPFQENTYVITNANKACWIVDPGMFSASENEELLHYIKSQNLTPKAIINTHAHLDHILGVHFLQETFEIPFYIHELDEPTLQYGPIAASMYGLGTIQMPKSCNFYKDELFDLGGTPIQVIHTPGHAPGHVILYCASENWVINGDMLFAGSIGRTDLPGGNHELLLEKVRSEIFSLPNDYVLYPGHGIDTTVESEKSQNPFFI